jgi:hypothetical protein
MGIHGIANKKQATGPGLKKIRLIRSVREFTCWYQDLVEIYDGFSSSENVNR